jgi:hypothetical protein
VSETRAGQRTHQYSDAGQVSLNWFKILDATLRKIITRYA